METKKFRRKKPKSSKGAKRHKKDAQISDRSLPKESPKTLIGMMNEKQKQESENKPGLMSLMKAVAQKKQEESKAAEENGDSKQEENSLASNPNLPKSTPPVFVTELAKQSELKLPAIREENTQDEIILHNNSAPPINQNAHSQEKRISTSHNSNKDVPDSGSKMDPVKGKHSVAENNVSLPPIQHEQTTKHNAVVDISAKQKELVPKLPALGGSQSSLNQGLETQRTEDDSASTVSSRWQTAITFVNQRVQERLTNVRFMSDLPYYILFSRVKIVF